MPDPGQLKGMLGNMFSGFASSGTTKYIMWGNYIFWSALILGGLYIFYLFFTFKYKLTIREGSIEKNESDGSFLINILKTYSDRAKAIKVDGVDKWKLMMTFGKTIEPIDNKYIQPGNFVDIFKTGPNAYNPIKIAGSNPSAVFNIDGFDSAFYYLGVQQDARDYQKDDALKKQQVMMMITVVLCLALAAFTIWFALKQSTGAVEKLDVVTSTLQSLKGATPI